MNVIEAIFEAMYTDDEPSEKQSLRLRRLYESSNEAEKEKIDAALICVCGWSAKTLLGKYNDDEGW